VQLTGLLWREHEPEHLDLTNDGETLLTIGFVHEATANVLLITAHPNGTLTMSYGKVKSPPHDTHVLGKFSDDGVLDIHEPTPLIQEQEPQ